MISLRTVRNVSAMVLLAGIISAATIHVPDDSATIQAGLNGASNLDTVLVAPGSYNGDGNRDLDFFGKRIVLRSGGGPAVTTIDCGGSASEPHQALRFHNGEDSLAIVHGFTITNGYWFDDPWPYDGGIVQCSASAPWIVNCVFTGNTGNGVYSFQNIAGQFGSGVHLDSCTISHNLLGGGLVVSDGLARVWLCDISGNDSAGVELLWQGTLRVSQLLIARNGKAGCLADVYAPSDFIVDSSTVFGNDSSGVEFYYEPPKGGEKDHVYSLWQTCVAFNGAAGILADGLLDFSAIACCNSFGNGGDDWNVYSSFGPGDEFGNMSADPLFCDTTNDNFYLDVLSACAPSHPLNSCGMLIGLFGAACGNYTDTDGDGWADFMDNCPSDYNPLQEDSDGDGIGDACDETSTWYVKVDGSGDAPTIQAAIDSASDFDTVLVAAGVYTGDGNRDLDTKGRRITVVSESGPSVTLISADGTPEEPHIGFVFRSGEDSSTIVEGFQIDDAFGDSLSYWVYGAVACSASTPTVRNCEITNNYGPGVSSMGWESRPLFIDCEISHNGGEGVKLMSGHVRLMRCEVSNNDLDGVVTEFSGEIRMDSCLVIGNGGTGVSAFTFFDDFQIYSSTFYGNGRGLFWDFNYPKDNPTPPEDRYNALEVRGNIFAFNQTEGVRAYFWDDTIAFCNNAYGNGTADWAAGALHFAGDDFGNIAAAPLFCNASSDNFSLATASPCLPENNSCNIQMGPFGEGCGSCCVRRGDVNHDGAPNIDISDLVHLVDYMFTGGPPPPCLEEGDVNGDGVGTPNIDISDLVYLVDYAFTGGPPPPPCGK